MIRRFALLSLGLVAAAPASAQTADAGATIQELRRFVNRHSLTVDTVRGIAIESRVSIGAPRGCALQIEQESTTRGVRATLVSRVDLARLSPEVQVLPNSAGDAGERTLELISSDGGEAFEVSVAIVGTRSSIQDWRSRLSFGTVAADSAARLFGAAIGACGGTLPSAEEAERIAAKRLHSDGNDPDTFPLKGRCLQMVTGLVPPATALPTDSSLTVGRFPRRSRIEVNGRIGQGEGARRFSCGFRQEGQEWHADGANLAPEQTSGTM